MVMMTMILHDLIEYFDYDDNDDDDYYSGDDTDDLDQHHQHHHQEDGDGDTRDGKSCNWLSVVDKRPNC